MGNNIGMKIYRIAVEKDIVAATMVLNNNKILILKRGQTAPWMPGKWNLPGGVVVEENEDISAAASRECQEEAGLTPNNLRFFNTYSSPHFDLNVFQAETNNPNVNMDFESSNYAWVGLEDYSNYDYVPFVREAIQSFLSSL